MPTRCIVAGCNAASKFESGQGCSFHSFPKNERMRRKWTIAVKNQRKDWKGPIASSVLCSKHFEASCFENSTKSYQYRNQMGFPDAVPTIFLKAIDRFEPTPSSSSPRPAFQKCQHMSVSYYIASIRSYNKNYSQIIADFFNKYCYGWCPFYQFCN